LRSAEARRRRAAILACGALRSPARGGSTRALGVMPRLASALALSAVALLQACTYYSLGDFCTFSDSAPFPKSTSSLGIVLAAPPGRIGEPPDVTLYRPSRENAEASLQLDVVAAPLPWPSSLDESRCKGVDWRTYRVETDADQWDTFWSQAPPFQIEGAVGSFDSMKRLPTTAFAFTIVDATTGEPIMSCGCYSA
jgi:hypothetical protein